MTYAEALAWLVTYDDCGHLDHPRYPLTVAASLVADIWDRSDDDVRRDLIAARDRARRTAA